MKKSFKLGLLFSSMALMLGLTSCKKDRTCVCTYDGSSATVGAYPNSTLADAKKLCDAYETQLKVDYSDASCKVK